MVQTKSFLISPPFNNLAYWIENTSDLNSVEELYTCYYELEELLVNSNVTKYIMQKDTSLGEINKIRISFWYNMN